MTGLLATQAVAARVHRLEDRPVADDGLHDVDTPLLHPDPETEVGHHRHDHRVVVEVATLVEIDGAHRDELVAVEERPRRVDGQDTVGVTVERETDVGAMHPHRSPAGPAGRSSRSRALMLEPSGSSWITVTSAPASREHARARPRRPLRWRSRRPPVPRRGGDRRARRRGDSRTRQRTSGPKVTVPTSRPAGPGVGDRVRRRARRAAGPARASSRCSVASSSLRPPGAKSLMPLSANGLCDAEIIAAGAWCAADANATPGVGSTPRSIDVSAFRCQAGGQRRGEHRPGLTGVASDQPAGPIGRCSAEHPGRAPPEDRAPARR